MSDVQKHSIQRFIERLKADLWPDRDDSGEPRFQVNSMDLAITDSRGNKVLVDLFLTPGVRGLQEVWYV